MKLPIKDKFLWPIAVLALAGVLILLGALQYRWTQELNEAAGDRMRAGLHASMVGFREDLARELLSAPLALQLDAHSAELPSDPEYYLERLESWKKTASHPDLVRDVYVGEFSDNHLQLKRLDPGTRQFKVSDWPSELAALQAPVTAISSDLLLFGRRMNGPGRSEFGHFAHHGGVPGPPWFIDESVPAVLGAVFERRSGFANPTETTIHSPVKWIIIQLNEDVLRQKVLPELALRYFGGSDGLTYDVAVLNRLGSNRVYYSSAPQFGTGSNIPTDARAPLFGPMMGRPEPPGRMELHEGPRHPDNPAGERGGMMMSRGGPLRLEPLRRASGPEGSWELIVRHRKGGLEAALAATRRGHLIISFGVLMLLAATMAMMIAVTRRAHRLASLQMQFVAGVSHELRTPLAVIASAADNIADGIVQDRNKIARYGKVIRDQSRQLTQLVEQILLFASTRQNGQRYNLVAISPAELVDRALASSAELIRTQGFTVERQMEATPDVMVDAAAVTHCLQNLITNAVKYGGDARWIGIRVEQATGNGNDGEVQISVQDRGIGIEPVEQQRIFDPFYRSPSVVGAQIHGTGLGLALAKGIAEDMKGRLTLVSKPGEGSTFTVYLPCVETAPATPDDKLTAAATSAVRGE